MEVGAIQVPVNPKSSVAEIAGFVQQVRPALIVTDADLAPTVDAAIVDAARRRRVDVGRSTTPSPTAGARPTSTSRRRGDDPDLGHDRAARSSSCRRTSPT